MTPLRDWKQETNLAARIRRLRKERDLTQRGLLPFGVKQSYLANLETGNIANPSPEMIANIARGLGVKVDELVKGTQFEIAARASKRPTRAYCPNNLCPKLQLNRYATGMIIPYRFSIERLQAGADKVYEAKFCPYCGIRLLSHCPKCKNPILLEDPQQSHCMHCGKSIFTRLTEVQVMAKTREQAP